MSFSSSAASSKPEIYPLVEHFYSLQGEGYWSGKPAYFLRFGGCDVGCSWCDTKYSWPMHGWQAYSIEEILSFMHSISTRHVVLTGGEPTLHPLSPLIEALQQAGYFVQIETSGAYPPPERLPDWITFSPKRFKPPHSAWYAIAHELKVVIHARSDLHWAEKQYALCTSAPVAFLQPDSYRPEAPQWILEYLRSHPHWRMSLQIHKYLSIP